MDKKNSYYLNEDETLKDDRVIEDLHKAIVMYENGEIIETHDVLSYIVNAIRKCTIKWLIYVKKKGRDCMSNRPSYYRNDEIKYKIDTAIQMVMFEKGKENWDTLLEVQDKLYDEFGLSIE